MSDRPTPQAAEIEEASEPAELPGVPQPEPAGPKPNSALAAALDDLYRQVLALRGGGAVGARTFALLGAGRHKMAKKVGEEAVEVVVDAVAGDVGQVVVESADLLYHLVVLWAAMGIEPERIAQEMQARATTLGIAEKWPKPARPETAPAMVDAAETGTNPYPAQPRDG